MSDDCQWSILGYSCGPVEESIARTTVDLAINGAHANMLAIVLMIALRVRRLFKRKD